MNAPATIHHPKRDDYYPVVRAFLPSARGEELDTRASLLLIRDRAIAALSYSEDEAAELLEFVHRQAVKYAFASMPLETLKELRRLLLNTTAAASGFQVLFCAPEQPEAQNARG